MTQIQRKVKITGRLEEMGIAYHQDAPGRLLAYHEMLCEWNTRMNLTGDTDFDTALDRLYIDSLAPLQCPGLFPVGASLVDVGSGAGFPGMPLAIVRPDIQVLLLDSLQKRIDFLKAVGQALGLTNVRTIHARAEDAAHAPSLRESFDLAVARAVAPLPVLCELLLPFVRIGGQMVCYKGPSAEAEQEEGTKAVEMLGGGPLTISAMSMPSQPHWRHCIVTCRKNQKTVRQYPRKAGLPSRSPLGKTDRG